MKLYGKDNRAILNGKEVTVTGKKTNKANGVVTYFIEGGKEVIASALSPIKVKHIKKPIWDDNGKGQKVVDKLEKSIEKKEGVSVVEQEDKKTHSNTTNQEVGKSNSKENKR